MLFHVYIISIYRSYINIISLYTIMDLKNLHFKLPSSINITVDVKEYNNVNKYQY